MVATLCGAGRRWAQQKPCVLFLGVPLNTTQPDTIAAAGAAAGAAAAKSAARLCRARAPTFSLACLNST
ncbi:hypothetical protein HaLaN_11255 [Haematococcus lacustris]|uniref:Uncharacterized protein n=1 Tax=Haematococcus lacustris TaxID=44745 RepID=A0A699YZT8_HAELA|nr:hypothetical protein HaLaN_11255 [Haematococcus lacustris]